MPYKDIEDLKQNKKDYYIKNKEKIAAKARIRFEKSGSAITIGDVYYKLTVKEVAPSYKRTSKAGKRSSRKMWLVECECGNKFEASGTKLRRGDIVMCSSCARLLGSQLSLKYTGIERAFNMVIVRRAKKINMSVSITREEFAEMASRNCRYCNAEPEERPYMNKSRLKVRLNGIDRVDSNKGYHLDNCVPCCKVCNMMKRDYAIDEFVIHIKKIHNNLSLGK